MATFISDATAHHYASRYEKNAVLKQFTEGLRAQDALCLALQLDRYGPKRNFKHFLAGSFQYLSQLQKSQQQIQTEAGCAVNFNVHPLHEVHGGWRSLELIASVVSESAEHDKLTITIWSAGRGRTSFCFELACCENAAPDLLARNLALALEMYDDDF